MKKLILFSIAVIVAVASFAQVRSSSRGNTQQRATTQQKTHNGHTYVDLGLPSGTLWATCNVGASRPEQYGNYYAWGEKMAKSYYGEKNSNWFKEDDLEGKGVIDIRGILTQQHDVAQSSWGGRWSTPTKEEMEELENKCKWQWTSRNGVMGQKVTGPNGRSIFLPANGRKHENRFFDLGQEGHYWSATPVIRNDGYFSQKLWFDKTHAYVTYESRYNGGVVRPVIHGKGVPSLEQMMMNSHASVDLGLSVRWATCNVGASSPEEYGDYFAWGETTPKSIYDWSTYKWCKGSSNTQTKYCNDSSYGYNGFTDNKTTLAPEDDAATVNWGADWRMPTRAEIDELRDKCTWRWTTQNGVNGRVVIGPNGRSIFLPAAGYRTNDGRNDEGSCGYYWSSSLWYRPTLVNIHSYRELKYIWVVYGRHNGLCVRPVREFSKSLPSLQNH